jgi:CBS domain-containing protein
MTNTLARDVMTQDPVCCKKDDTVYDAVKIMSKENCGVVPIVDDNKHCIGVITDRDICLNVVLHDIDSRATSLDELMTPHPVTCRETEQLDQIIEKMEENQIKRIVVEDDNGRCCGIISERDIVTQEPDSEQIAEFVTGVYS